MLEDNCELKSIHTQVISLIIIVALVAETNLFSEKKVPINSQLHGIFFVTN